MRVDWEAFALTFVVGLIPAVSTYAAGWALWGPLWFVGPARGVAASARAGVARWLADHVSPPGRPD